MAARAQVGVTQPAPVAPVGVAPVGAGAGVVTAPTMGATPVGAVGGVKASGVNTGLLLLLGQIADGQMTMDSAWDKGLLDAPKVLQLLSQTQRLTEDERNEALQRDLAGLLVRFAPATVATSEVLNARVRVALCRYYSSTGDARAVPLCEALIAEKLEGKQVNQPLASNPDGGSSSLYLSSVILLAQYYQNVNQWRKAGETWERALTFWQDVGWWQVTLHSDAALAYEKAGDLKKAESLYSSATITNLGWMDGLVVTNQAQFLIKAGRYEEARRVLNKGVMGPDAKYMKPFLLTNLGDSYYQAGDFEQAASYARQAINSYKDLLSSPHSVYLDAVLPLNQERLRWIERFVKEPIICAPRQLNVVRSYLELNIEDDGITRQFYVRTLRPVPLRVSSDNPLVTARIIEDQSKKPQQRHYYQQEISVSIAPEAIRKGAQATLTINSPDIPSFQVQMPVLINKQVASTTSNQP